MEENKHIVLDTEAQKLFEQLGGTESWKEKQQGSVGTAGLAQSLLEEQKRHDAVRIDLVHMAHLLSRYLGDARFTGQNDQENRVFEQLAGVLARLNRAPGHLGAVFIRFRGASSNPQLPDKYDYEIVIGNTMVDMPIAPRIVRRNGSQHVKLPDRMRDAFAVFADYGVNNIYVQLPDPLPQGLPSIQKSLRILCGFRQARQTGKPIRIGTAEDHVLVPVINDENQYPDPNLTLLAGLNRLSIRSMETLVEKVDQWLRRRDKDSAVNKYAGVYNAALELPKIKAQLQRPLVELNNVKWLISGPENVQITQQMTYIAQLAMDSGGASPQVVAKMIKSIYGDDYARINAAHLCERLHLSSNLLQAAEKRKEKAQINKELMGNLQIRLDQVKDHVIDDLQVREDKGELRDPGQPPAADVVHSQIYKLVSFYKGRSATRKKMVGMVHNPIRFEDRDYDILSKDFSISLPDAKALVSKLKACFGENGGFKKGSFHEAIPHLTQYEQKIFEFLWHHMKDAIAPRDRVPFLNCLQTLTGRMNQPKRAFKVLLEDICSDPEKVQFSDNKAVMLANMILHRPDKSLADYEITPEDIVLHRHNLDAMVVEYAGWRIEKEKDPFLTKAQTIHNKLNESLNLGHTSDKQIPATVMLNLERELYIFLTLVECDTGKAILRSAVSEFGDPDSEVFGRKESQEYMSGLLQILRVALRGLGTIGSMQDIGLLEAVKEKEESFQRLKKERQHRAQARMITDWVNEAVKIIKFRS